MSQFTDWLEHIAARAFTQWWEEWRKVSIEFWDTLGEIWGTRPSIFRILFLGPAAVLPELTRTLDAFQEWRQDSALIWQRVASDLVSKDLPLPKAWSHRVVTMDDAARFFLGSALDFSIGIQDADLPAEVDVAVYAHKYATFKRVQEGLVPLGQAARGGFIFLAVETLIAWLQLAAALGIAAWAVLVVFKANTDESLLRELALPQDSRRVRGRQKHQFRQNKQKGRDVP